MLTINVIILSLALWAQAATQQQPPNDNPPWTSAHEPQTQKGANSVPQQENSQNDSDLSIPLTEPVVTIRGVCPPPGGVAPTSGEACATVVSRREFDDMITIAAPGAKTNPAMRRSVAQMYAELLAFEAAATKAGIPDSPEFQETIRLLRLRTLADLYRRSLEKQFINPSKMEIDEFYLRETSRFEEVKLRRIVLPKNNFAAGNKKEEFEKKALQVATDLRERAAKGEDFDQLQREAFATLGLSGQPPQTDAGTHRRATLLPEVSDEIFALGPGQMSKVEKEPYSFVIYKVEAKRLLPEQLVKDEISREISKEKLENALRAVTGSVQTDLNTKYFGAPGEQNSPTAPVRGTSR